MFIKYANGINDLKLTDSEIGIFSGLVLFSHDRPALADVSRIQAARERLLEGLRVQIVRGRPDTPNEAIQVMPALVAKIPELRAISARHCLHLEWLRQNWANLRLPPLFAELFDIPKSDDYLQ